MEKYNCKCLKCGKDFISNDSADADGEGFCLSCQEEKKSIAEKVDAQIAIRRANGDTTQTTNIYQEIRKKRRGSLTYMNL